MLRFLNTFQAYRNQLVLSFLAVSLIPLFVLVGYQSFLFVQAERLSMERQRVQTEQIAREIQSFVEMHRRGIEAAAKQATQFQHKNRDLYDSILASLHKQFPGFINLYFADAKAVTKAFYPEFNQHGQSMVGVDFSTRWHYKALLRNPRTYISPVMQGIGGTEKLLCTIVSPLFDELGHFDGFVLGALNLEKVASLIRSHPIDAKGYVVLTDSIGQAIYEPRWSADSPPKLIEEEKFLRERLRSQKGVLRHQSPISQSEVMTTYVTLDNPAWSLWISTPIEQLQVGRKQWIASSLVLLLVTICVIVLASRALSHRLSNAVETLSKKADLLKERDFDKARALQINEKAPDDLRSLDRAFDSMTRSLDEAYGKLNKANAFLDERVRERSASLRAALLSMRDPFGLIDKMDSFTFINQPMRMLLGQRLSKSKLPTVEEFLCTLEQSGFCVCEDLRKTVTGKESTAILTDHLKHSWQVDSFEVIDQANHYGLAILFRDVTEEKRLSEIKDSLISIVAHEFKTPLSAIKMQAETLARQDVKLDESLKMELIQGISDDALRLGKLVSDWLDLTRIQSDSLHLQQETFPVRDVIEQARRAVLAHGQFDMDVQVASDSELCTADPERLVQILLNLFGNAIRYCDSKAQIKVSVYRSHGEYKVEVKDNGIGIAPQHIDRIFDKFHQVDMSSKRRQGGTGLGLAISRGIARAHGGDLVVSSSLNQGSIFTIILKDSV